MGAFMNISTLWLADNSRIDWEAGERALAAFKCPTDGFPQDSPLSGSFLEDAILEAYNEKNATTEAQRKTLVDALVGHAFANVRRSVENGSSEVAEIRHGGWKVFASGGLTHSDPATDFAEDIDTLDGTGILEAAGFNSEPYESSTNRGALDHEKQLTAAADALKPHGGEVWHSGGGIHLVAAWIGGMRITAAPDDETPETFGVEVSPEEGGDPVSYVDGLTLEALVEEWINQTTKYQD